MLSCSVPIALWNCTTGLLADRKNKQLFVWHLASAPPGTSQRLLLAATPHPRLFPQAQHGLAALAVCSSARHRAAQHAPLRSDVHHRNSPRQRTVPDGGRRPLDWGDSQPWRAIQGAIPLIIGRCVVVIEALGDIAPGALRHTALHGWGKRRSSPIGTLTMSSDTTP